MTADEAGRPLEGRTILVVEDDDDSREIMVQVLEASGARVVTAEGGVTALERLRRLVPDAIVTDLAMPAGTGVSLVRSVRADPATVFIPVIAVTGYADLHRALAGDESFDRVLTKPVDPELLVSVVQTLAGRRPQ